MEKELGKRVEEAFRPPAADLLPAWLPTRQRNRLPLAEYKVPGRFFITITTTGRRRWFQQDEIVSYCVGSLREACQVEGFDLLAYCFMPDHVHLLVSADDECDLIRLIHRFKQRTGWWFRNRFAAGGLKASPTSSTTRASLWQKSYYDHVLRREEDLEDVIHYILGNPVRAGLASFVGDYPHAWSAFGVLERA